MQPSFALTDKKQKQPTKFMLLFKNEISKDDNSQKDVEDPKKYFNYKPLKIGKNLLIEENEAYVVPSIQTGTQDIFFGRYTDPKDKKVYVGSIISNKKANTSSLVYLKGGKLVTLKEGDIEILCAKDLTNYSWEQANTG